MQKLTNRVQVLCSRYRERYTTALLCFSGCKFINKASTHLVLFDRSLACLCEFCPPCRDLYSQSRTQEHKSQQQFHATFSIKHVRPLLLISNGKSPTFSSSSFSSPIIQCSMDTLQSHMKLNIIRSRWFMTFWRFLEDTFCVCVCVYSLTKSLMRFLLISVQT